MLQMLNDGLRSEASDKQVQILVSLFCAACLVSSIQQAVTMATTKILFHLKKKKVY